jgi:hypothetical protein
MGKTGSKKKWQRRDLNLQILCAACYNVVVLTT